MNRVAVAVAAIAIDLAFGDPPNRWHPVAWMGALLARGRRAFARGSPVALTLGGAAVTVGVALLATAGARAAGRVARRSGVAGWVLEAALLKSMFSLRGLGTAAAAVRADLERGDLEAARRTLGCHLVSRSTSDLDAGHVASGAVESVAENLTDSVVAPLLFYLALDLPGAAFYRAINTADAMLGYRQGALEYFGKTAARLDDVLNVVPAQLAAWAIVAGALVAGAGAEAAPAIRVMRRDHARTASPNAGRTMAAMAGALGVTLEKPGAYRLGDGPLPAARDIDRSLTVLRGAVIASAAGLMAVVGLTKLTQNR